jgi:hypothetical protein
MTGTHSFTGVRSSTHFPARLPLSNPMFRRAPVSRHAARVLASLVSLLAVAALAACGESSMRPSNDPPARIDAASALVQTGTVGSAVAMPIVVKLADVKGRPAHGATVTFAVTLGNGSVSPRVVTSDNDGQAKTTWTLGTAVGANEVTASAGGVTTPVKFTATATAGPVASIALAPLNPRILAGSDTVRVTAQSLDAFGNPTSPIPTLVARDPTLLEVAPTGTVRALRRGASTYLVATAGTKSDSTLVWVLDVGQSACTGLAAPISMAVGEVRTDVSGTGVCVRAETSGEQYAMVPYYNSNVPSATRQIQVMGLGITSPGPAASTILASRSPLPSLAGELAITPNVAFERQLRSAERRELTPRAEGARAWFAQRRLKGARVAEAVTRGTEAVGSVSSSAPRAAELDAAAVIPSVGDLVPLNANASSGCTNPDMRVGRVVAVTDKAIVIADTENPAGGFADDEYRSFGVTFDTLLYTLDVNAFGGPPSDIDGNGRVIMFFTRAVNQLSAKGSSSVILGFFYSRDIYPKTGTNACAASNAAEMFYLLVPDPTGSVGPTLSKATTTTLTNGTVAHEFQHLINASRRLYVNKSENVFEEKWLDEGLAHIAEELAFFKATGRTARQNYDDAGFTDPNFFALFQTYQRNNFARYRSYLPVTETQGPIGLNQFDDDLQTRGAIWSFLRFAADHQPGGGDGTFWARLANSKLAGIENLTAALGTDPAPLFRDWAISNYLDDNAAGGDPRFQQPSWNFRAAMPAAGFLATYPLTTRALSDGLALTVTISGGSVSFLRFGVPAGQDALITTTSLGLPLPTSIQLAVVRTK